MPGEVLSAPGKDDEQATSGSQGLSKEDRDVIGRNIKKHEDAMEVESASETNDTPMKEQSTVNEENTSENSKEKTQAAEQKAQGKPTQISYRASLLGHEPMEVDKDFDELVKEWLEEEKAMAPVYTEEQKKIIEKLPRIDIPDERWKQMCLPWKDAIVIKPLGRRFYLYELKDRLRWLWGAPDFELIDLPNNYYVIRTEEKQLRQKILNDGPWVPIPLLLFKDRELQAINIWENNIP